jgi:hypothetical protein
MTSPEGLGRTDIFLGRVVNVDLVNYTVDVFSQFDQQRCFQIPVGSPYLHANRGDGFSVMPEVGAKCAVCWPGDSSPPFVLAFVMPHETIPMATSPDAPDGTTSHGSDNQSATNASFAGGRPTAKPGDMFVRGRDGNFIVLHRGGVLQIGANELSQRIYVPLNNMVMDFAENYAMHTAGGSIRWGIQEGEGITNLPTEYKQALRVYANDKYADIRIAAGRVHDPVPEVDEDALVDQQVAELGKTEPIVYELTLARGGFNGEDSSLLPNTGSLVKLKFSFDRAGNAFLKFNGNVGLLCTKKLRLRVKQEMEIFADNTFNMSVKNDAKVTVGGTFELTGKVIKFNGGKTPIATLGSTVTCTLPPNLLMAVPGPPGFAPIGGVPMMLQIAGSVTSGDATLLGNGG